MNNTEELKQELGNAIAAYAKVLRKATLGVSTPGFEKLLDCSPAELTRKYKVLKDFYETI
jgi:hypothetical protein